MASWISLLCLFFTLLSPSWAGTYSQVTSFGDNSSGTKMYIYVPTTLASKPAILVAVHYCTGTAQAYYTGTPYAQYADTYGFIVIYPESPYSGTCWDVSSKEALTHDGGADTTSIANMVKYTISKYGADSSRVYVTGTSSGAMMTNVLAATYPDIFAAGIVYSGVPAGCFYTGTVNGWNSTCSQGNVVQTAAQWAKVATDMYPGYTGSRPKMQIYHGSVDTVLYPNNWNETMKQWSGVFGYSGPTEVLYNNPSSPYVKYVYGSNLEGIYGIGIGHSVSVMGAEDLKWFGFAGGSTPTSTTQTNNPTSTTTSATATATGQAPHWGQCGGIGWTGATTCVSPYTCTYVNDSPPPLSVPLCSPSLDDPSISGRVESHGVDLFLLYFHGMMAEKSLLSSQLSSPVAAAPRHRNRPLAHAVRALAVASFLLLSFQIFYRLSSAENHQGTYPLQSEAGTGDVGPQTFPSCPAQHRVSPVARPDITENNVQRLFKSSGFRNLSIERLAGAIQVPTETFENLGRLGEDKRWDVFYNFEKYLRQTFPLLHEKLHLELVNEHGLLYTWQGSNEQLKPILLMAHQDTVPVAADTLSEWKYPPFSGHFDGEFIYGRGSSDCKNNLIAILSSITSLLDQEFIPQRTVVLSFGFDEETSGFQYGAAQLSKKITENWGPDSFAIIIDEGQPLIVERFGRSFGIPQVSERGYFDLELTVHIPGGHSSIPPAHTSIGILAQAIATLENVADANFPLELKTDNPFYTLLQCAAEDPLAQMPKELRDAIGDPDGTSQIVRLLSHDPIIKSLFHTTQAVTIFQGGNKANALPAFANGLVNYRVSSTETVGQVREKLFNTLKPVAEKFGLKFTAGPKPGVGEPPAEVPEYTLALSWNNAALEPSPVTSTDSPSWAALSGVTKHVFDEAFDGGDVIVAPMQIIGNTDTRYYWDLSSQIYRFGPGRDRHSDGMGGIHDVNEHVPLELHLEAILFFHEFIRVFDEAVLE